MARKVSELIARRTGHFQMESGYHSEAWFELDSLFHAPEKLRPFVSELARRLSPHRPESVCGPMTGGAALAALIATELGIDHLVAERLEATDVSGLFPITYRIPPGQREMARGRSVAIVDDAISAGSAVRGTHSDLIACGARPVALGALIVFGDAPRALAAEAGLPLESIERLPLAMWRPADCPLCASAVALERVAAAGP